MIKQKNKIKTKINKIKRASMDSRIRTGQFGYIFYEIAHTDPKKCFNYMRMPLSTFNEIFKTVWIQNNQIGLFTLHRQFQQRLDWASLLDIWLLAAKNLSNLISGVCRIFSGGGVTKKKILACGELFLPTAKTFVKQQ